MSLRTAAAWVLGGLILATTVSSQTTQNRREHNAQSAAPSPAARTKPAPGPDLARAEQVIVHETNQFRKEQGRGRLRINPKLSQAAREFARYLAKTGKFSHTADGKQPWERTAAQGYEDCIVAENIAWEYHPFGFGTRSLADALVKGWENSPEHRKNMLDPDLDEIGVGVAYSPDTGRYYAVQDFGRPRSEQNVFALTNDTVSPVSYRVDGKDFTVQPRYTVTHTRCRPPTITVNLPGASTGKGAVFHPHNGAHYVIRSDSSGKVRVEEQ
jgi:uncharacterized protein YkwD